MHALYFKMEKKENSQKQYILKKKNFKEKSNAKTKVHLVKSQLNMGIPYHFKEAKF